MSQQWSQLKSYLGLSALVSLYGIASLAVLYLGPSLGLGLTEQIVIIVLILVTWPFAILIGHLVRRRREHREAAGSSASSDISRGGNRTEAGSIRNYEELTRTTEETVRWLRSTRLGSGKSSDVIYRLPWFLVAGPPGSGKTSLLLSAGLDYHALPSQRRADQNLIRPTQSLEFRVSDSAVLLDTSGRYQQEGEDADEWCALVETIKKYRKVRPVDGMVIPVSAARVLGSSESEIEQQAKILRGRLDELMSRAQSRFPVYLVFTNMDVIQGFGDFFHQFGSADRAQVWGATIPLEQTPNAHALFDVEFDYLYDALMQQRLLRLSEPADPAEQLQIFDFPLLFAQARRKLGLFSSALFRPNPFSENPMLRGFYFTSAASNGGSRGFEPAGAIETVAGDGQRGEAKTAEDGYFGTHLLGDVLVRDKDLAASFGTGRRHTHRVRNGLVAVAAILLALFTVGMFVSFAFNKVMIAEARDRGQNVLEIAQRDNGKDPGKKGSAESRTELEAVDSLRQLLAELDDYDRHSPPLYLRFGLYSGNDINERLREVYFDSINQRFFKNAAAAVERELKSLADGGSQVAPDGSASAVGAVLASAPSGSPGPASDDLGRYYDLLKAYLMISSGSDKAEWAFLDKQLADYWMRSAPRELEVLAEQQLIFYSKQADTPDSPHWPANDALVGKTRRKLEAYPAIDRFYKSITTEVNEQVQPITLDSIVHGQERGWLSGSPSVAGSFTLRGYRDYMVKAFSTATGEISKDDWVMGSTTKGQTADISKLREKYFTEYAAQWRAFLKETRVTKFNTKDDVREALKVMSGLNSPVAQVIGRAASETDLGRSTSTGGFFAWIKGLFGGGKSASGAGGTTVEREFGPLQQFASGDGDKAGSAVTQYRNELQSLRDQLEPGSGDQLAQTSGALLTSKDDIALQKAEQSVGRLLEPLNTPASKDAGALMMQPLRNIRAMQTVGTFDQIDQIWRNQIYPRAKALESGFPFTDGGEASVEDLARLLNPSDGELWVFFKSKLAGAFEDVQGRWKLLESGAFSFSPEFVEYLNNARQVRDALFATGSRQPSINYELALQPVTGADVVLEIDGNPPVVARSGSPGAATLKWPAQVGDVGAKITLTAGGSAPQTKTFQGKWGLFRMIQQAQKTGDNQYVIALSLGSGTARATIHPASSANNPFQLNIFKLMHAPESPK